MNNNDRHRRHHQSSNKIVSDTDHDRNTRRGRRRIMIGGCQCRDDPIDCGCSGVNPVLPCCNRRKKKLRTRIQSINIRPASSFVDTSVNNSLRSGNRFQHVYLIVAAIIMSTSSLIFATATSPRIQTQQQQQQHNLDGHRPLSTVPVHIRRDKKARQLQTLQQCQIALAIGDSNRDDVLAGEGEYPRFVNQLSGQQFAGAGSVSDLPQAYQDSYSRYADSSIGGINVQGSKPGQTPTAAQEQQLNALCTETIAILNGEDIQPGPPTTAPAPTDAPQPTGGDSSNTVDCTGTVARSQCNTGLAIADLSRDDLLNEAEYVRFVNRLSSNAYAGSSFDDLPGNVKDNYDKFATTSNQVNIFGSKPGQSADATQDAFLDDFCCETDLAIQNPGAPTQPAPPPPTPAPAPSEGGPPTGGGGDLDCTGTVPRSQCNTAMSIADLSRDDLLNEAEYVRFVNRLSSNEYAGSSFEDLPSNIQATFNEYATTGGQVDISGSKPGQTATPEQDEFLDNFCCEADLAIQNPGQPVDVQPTPGPGPGPPSSPGTLPPTFAETFCRTAMASSDFNRDDQLNEEEYVRFLNRLTSNEFAGQDFSDLSQALQTNFVTLAGPDNQIDIFGSKPGQAANDQQEDFLDRVCLDTAIALNDGVASPPVTPAPGPGGPTSPPTFADTVCFTAMASSDFNRDDFLNEEEYIRFLNRLTRNQYDGVGFDDLPSPLQASYNDLASNSDNGQIYIFGSKPGQTATDDQQAFLEEVCLDTAIAINEAEGGTTPGTPTEVPAGPPSDTPAPVPDAGGEQPAPPTFPPGLSEVYNSFIVANTLGLSASDLQSGANREGLDDAYTEFAVRSVRQIGIVSGSRRLHDGSVTNSSIPVLSRLRRRKLVVDLVEGSTIIYLLEDSECPDSIQSVNTCQTAFAQFQVSITDEDPQTVSDEYTAASQAQIRNGLLQTTLTEVDPRNALEVINASFPVRSTVPPTEAPVAPTEAPASAPPSGGGDDESGSSSIGAIMGGLIGGLVVIAIGAYIYFRGVPFGMSAPSFKFGGRGGNKTDDEDDGEGGFDKDDDASAADKDDDDFGTGANAFGSNNKNTFGGDDDDDDDDDEKEGQDAKNVFGFRKKEKEGDENRGFGFEEDYGLDSKDSAHNSFGDENGGGKYEFDEPSEVREDDDDEKGSVNANEDPFGTAPASPGWGNAFGSNNEWGANNAEGNNSGQDQNFFGDSAFGDDGGEGDGSRSGSESDSYTSSEDSTYESEGGDDGSRDQDDEEDYDEEDGSGSYSRSSADEDRSSYNSGSTPGSMASELRRTNEDMDAAIESGDWDAVAKAADTFGKSQDSSFEGSSKRDSEGEMSGDMDDEEYSDDDRSGSYSGSSRSGSMSESNADGSATSATTTSEDLEKRDEYRAQVDALVKLVLPDETDKVDAMMEQFKGREAELVSTLQTMQERSANQRARAAVHKSKTRPQRSEAADGAYALGANGGASGGEGAAAGTAAIAAASLPIPAAGMFGDEEDEFGGEDGDEFADDDAFGEDPQYDDDEDRSYYSDEDGSRSGSRSYYSGEEDGSGPYSDEGSYSGEGSHSHSGYSGEDSRRESQRSGFSGEDSRRSGFSGEGSRSHYSGEDSRRSGFSGEGSQSYYSGEDSRRSGFSGEDSRRSGFSGEGSRSQYSGEDSRRSGFSGEGSRSQYSGEDSRRSEFSGSGSGSGSRSRYSDEGSGSRSHYSGEDSRRSDFSGEEGSRSQYSDEGSRSRYSDEEGSRPYSDEGSRSYYSGEEDGEGSYYDDEEGSFTGSQEGDGSQSQSWG